MTFPANPNAHADPVNRGMTIYSVALSQDVSLTVRSGFSSDCAPRLQQFAKGIQAPSRKVSIDGRDAYEADEKVGEVRRYIRCWCGDNQLFLVNAHWPANKAMPGEASRILNSFRVISDQKASSAFLPQPQSPGTLTDERRFNYSADHFSIALPKEWVEIEAKVLAQMPDAVKKRVPNAPEVAVKYGFRHKDEAFPWVGIVISDDRLTDETFANLSGAFNSLDRYMDHMSDPTAGGTMQKGKMTNLYYDKGRHALWGMSQSSFSDIGDLQTLSVAYLTKVGTVQVHCYSKASDYEKYKSLFRRIAETIEIDPSVSLQPK